jgi:hypothetical protein
MWIRIAHVSLKCLFVVTLLLISANSAMAQGGAGVRAGVSLEPDQFYFGGHVDVKEIVDRFWFRPNAEIGVGNHTTLFSANGEFVYFLPVRSNEWKPYFGGGPAFVLRTIKVNDNRDTDVGPGFNFVGGIQQQKGLLAEIKIGAIDSPNFKLGIGWTW